jgi:hypothetical protein
VTGDEKLERGRALRQAGKQREQAGKILVGK